MFVHVDDTFRKESSRFVWTDERIAHEHVFMQVLSYHLSHYTMLAIIVAGCKNAASTQTTVQEVMDCWIVPHQ